MFDYQYIIPGTPDQRLPTLRPFITWKGQGTACAPRVSRMQAPVYPRLVAEKPTRLVARVEFINFVARVEFINFFFNGPGMRSATCCLACAPALLHPAYACSRAHTKKLARVGSAEPTNLPIETLARTVLTRWENGMWG